MDKAIAILTDNLHKAEQYLATTPMDSDMLRGWAEIIKEHSEALAELQATQAKLGSLREYCNSAYVPYPNGHKFALGYMQARKDILTKLDEGSKQ